MVLKTKISFFLLERYTPVFKEFKDYFYLKNDNTDEAILQRELEIFTDKIHHFYLEDKSNWIDRTITLLEEKRKSVPDKDKINYLTVLHKVNEKSGVAGIINFDVTNERNYWFKDTDLALKENEDCIVIHVLPIFGQKNNNPQASIFSDDSLGELAKEIRNKHLNVKYIIAKSWLLDTVIAKLIQGLNIYKKEKFSPDGGFWRQFIDIDGSLNQKRVKEFLETGQAKYQIGTGAIPVDVFLDKYLPKETQ